MRIGDQPVVSAVPRVRTRRLPFWVEPAEVFARIAHLHGSVLLESQPVQDMPVARYSIICTQPFGVLHTAHGRTTLDLPSGPSRGHCSPFDALREVLASHATAHSPGVVFPGGVVGYLGYELLTFLEDVSISGSDDLGLPDCWLGFYNHAAVFDHLERDIMLNGCLLPGMPSPEGRLDELESLVLAARSAGGVHAAQPECRTGALLASLTKARYCAAVERVKDYIAAGDIYQANISQRFSVPFSADPWSIYRDLRRRNPAPYAAYLNLGDLRIISSSPECFLLHDPGSRLVTTRPIKGTRPRSADPDEDHRLARELTASAKDMAENVMIVDLERNDLGRVCEYGSVRVPELAVLESYPTVHHLVSTVTGTMRRECDVADLLTVCFPGGSITGAPKIRAMQIIDELEPVRRGVYTGSIGYLGFDGSVNLNIAIRTAVIKDSVCQFHVGGGIVADSDPEMEYQETLDKGRAILEVLRCQCGT